MGTAKQSAELGFTGTPELLGTLRRRAGLSRDELARRTGKGPGPRMATGTVTRYESGEVVQPDAERVRALLRVIAEELGHDPDKVWRDYLRWLLETSPPVDRIAADIFLATQVRAALAAQRKARRRAS